MKILNDFFFFFNKIYIADPEGYALIVWLNETFVRINGSEFRFDKNFISFNIFGEPFKLPSGIRAMQLEPESDSVIFAPMASHNLSIIRNISSKNDLIKKNYDFQSSMIFRTQPTAFQWSAEYGIFFAGLTDNSVICWNGHDFPKYRKTSHKYNYVSCYSFV